MTISLLNKAMIGRFISFVKCAHVAACGYLLTAFFCCFENIYNFFAFLLPHQYLFMLILEHYNNILSKF